MEIKDKIILNHTERIVFVPDNKRTGLRAGSRILGAFDTFCDGIYLRLRNGLFGGLFTLYPDISKSLCGNIANSDFRKKTASPLRRKLASKIEDSAFMSIYTRLVKYLLDTRLRVYGVSLMAFFAYTAILAAYSRFRGGEVGFLNIALPAILCIASCALLLSDITLAGALKSGAFGNLMLKLVAKDSDSISDGRSVGKSNIAFALGIFLGLCAHVTNPLLVVGGILALTVAMLIMNSPEFGTVMLIFFMPILSTVPLSALSLLTVGSFLIKVIRGKRVFRFEAIDIFAFFFTVLTAIAGVFGASNSSILSGLIMVSFILGFFLCVFTLTTREWLTRAVIALTASSTVIAFYGMLQYVTVKVAGSNQWVDQKMFSYIEGRATATLENPNMLAVYLIICIPVVFNLAVNRTKGFRQRSVAMICLLSVGACLIFTWTRGAWLGLLVAALVFLMIWTRKSIYVFFCGILSIPFLPYVVPANIWARFTSIGNKADSSTFYRIDVMKSSIKLLPDYIFNGLGVGEKSWYLIFPKIAMTGVQWVPHSHNFYIQVWIQTGLVSLVVLLVFLFFLFSSNFKLYRIISDTEDFVMSKISVSPLKDTDGVLPRKTEERNDSSDNRRKKTLLRLDAAAPLCGVFAVLVMGFTDYVWYNYRVFLSFWLVCGLSSAFVRFARREIENHTPRGEGEDELSGTVTISISPSGKKIGKKS